MLLVAIDWIEVFVSFTEAQSLVFCHLVTIKATFSESAHRVHENQTQNNNKNGQLKTFTLWIYPNSHLNHIQFSL